MHDCSETGIPHVLGTIYLHGHVETGEKCTLRCVSWRASETDLVHSTHGDPRIASVSTIAFRTIFNRDIYFQLFILQP